MSQDPWDAEPEQQERDPWPSHEEIVEEERYRAALDAVEKKKKVGMFTQVVLDAKKKNALELWVPPPDKDHGRQIRGTIDTNTGLFISRLIASKKWPWRNESDFVRSAIKSILVHEKLEDEEGYREYFSLHWEMCRRAQLVYRLKDATSLVAHLKKAVEAHLGLNQIDEAARWLRDEVAELTVQDDEFSHAVLKRLEEVMTTGGPGLMAVWRRL
jgi:hypothetical protein